MSQLSHWVTNNGVWEAIFPDGILSLEMAVSKGYRVRPLPVFKMCPALFTLLTSESDSLQSMSTFRTEDDYEFLILFQAGNGVSLQVTKSESQGWLIRKGRQLSRAKDKPATDVMVALSKFAKESEIEFDALARAWQSSLEKVREITEKTGPPMSDISGHWTRKDRPGVSVWTWESTDPFCNPVLVEVIESGPGLCYARQIPDPRRSFEVRPKHIATSGFDAAEEALSELRRYCIEATTWEATWAPLPRPE